jgi:hypothetical protein
MKVAVMKEVVKLLDAGIIYPILDSKWVSPTQVVPKKFDNRKLNSNTWKYHFPLPFTDQILECLVGQSYYCFLDGYFGYNQVVIDPQDQERRRLSHVL